MGCCRNLSERATGWVELGARLDPALQVELSVLEHSLCWESPSPWVCVAVIESLSRKT